ncbi:hypothetical protein NL676_007032 [Syzygium grande]|nr:hypothetical protein NL676_007032 [Syzygium grande]
MITGCQRTGSLDDALKLFYEVPMRDAICWKTIIKCCLDYGHLMVAEELFDEMPEPSVVSWTTMIDGFFRFGQVEQIHGHVFKSGFCLSRFVCAPLITFYANCKHIEKATQVFNEAVSRNVVICAALLTGYGSNVLESLDRGKEVHASAVKPKLGSDVFVGNSLVVMYNKCGGVDDAVVVFKRLGRRTLSPGMPLFAAGYARMMWEARGSRGYCGVMSRD